MDNYAIESFIDFCDDMEIAQEGSIGDNLKKIKNWIITQLKRLINWFKSIWRKIQDKRLELRVKRNIGKIERELNEIGGMSDDELMENIAILREAADICNSLSEDANKIGATMQNEISGFQFNDFETMQFNF